MTLEILNHQPEGPAHPVPLLCVHGIMETAQCFEAHFLPYFAEHGFDASAVSLRGHGGSSIEQSLRWTSLADYVSDVAEAASQIEARTGAHPLIIGHSMGGIITQKYLETHTAPGAVLMASVPHFGALLTMLRITWRSPLTALRILGTLKVSPLARSTELARWAFFSADTPDETIDAHRAAMGEESFRILLDMGLLSLPRRRRINAPLLVIGAANDAIITPGDVQRTARHYDTEAVILPDIAHCIPREANWQAAADVIIDWVVEHISAPADASNDGATA